MKNPEDQESWRDFFQTYWKLIYSVARRSGLSDAEAQDAVQETLLAVMRNIPKFRIGSEHGSFRGWLLRMARWRINDQFRKRPSALVQEGEAMRIAAPEPSDFETAWEVEWKGAVMQAAVDKVKERVDPEFFQLWHLQVVQGMPALNLARKFGVKLSRIYFSKYKVSRLVRKEVLSMERALASGSGNAGILK
jgi:RNA polymerase sigma factor (sigma-70 family)